MAVFIDWLWVSPICIYYSVFWLQEYYHVNAFVAFHH